MAIFSSRLYAKDNSVCITRRRRNTFMLSKPVVGVTSLVATSEAATLQEIQTDNIYLQQTMQVRKRNGSGEPVDVTRIVCAVQ
jgi:hypothetical protein